MRRSLTIEEGNLSIAWARALFCVVEEGEISPLTVVIRGFEDGKPAEVEPIRRLLDDALGAEDKALSCHEVANTIFPVSLWNPGTDRTQLYERYLRIMPRVLRDRRNRYGVYFQRMIAFGHNADYEGGVNQLEHIIQTWNGGNHRRSALQAAIFDPRKDHTNQRMRGFPCLQQVAFAPQGPDGLEVTGFYATQYIYERAYGNYLGLCRLGHFVAHEMGRDLTQVNCVSSPALGGNKTKSFLRGLAGDIGSILDKLGEDM
ncbi:MAG: thymidylate synthase [Dehalococcoidia bacterium]|nr:thymidylate synthase [Dehalococcoidia bacterium]MYF78659.1 thymidylate synthase [Chloroflexota bacterium]